MWALLKVFIEFVTVLILFYVLIFWAWGMWNLSSLTRSWTHLVPPTTTPHSPPPCIGRWSLNHWSTKEVVLFSQEAFLLDHQIIFSPDFPPITLDSSLRLICSLLFLCLSVKSQFSSKFGSRQSLVQGLILYSVSCVPCMISFALGSWSANSLIEALKSISLFSLFPWTQLSSGDLHLSSSYKY